MSEPEFRNNLTDKHDNGAKGARDAEVDRIDTDMVSEFPGGWSEGTTGIPQHWNPGSEGDAAVPGVGAYGSDYGTAYGTAYGSPDDTVTGIGDHHITSESPIFNVEGISFDPLEVFENLPLTEIAVLACAIGSEPDWESPRVLASKEFLPWALSIASHYKRSVSEGKFSIEMVDDAIKRFLESESYAVAARLMAVGAQHKPIVFRKGVVDPLTRTLISDVMSRAGTKLTSARRAEANLEAIKLIKDPISIPIEQLLPLVSQMAAPVIGSAVAITSLFPQNFNVVLEKGKLVALTVNAKAYDIEQSYKDERLTLQIRINLWKTVQDCKRQIVAAGMKALGEGSPETGAGETTTAQVDNTDKPTPEKPRTAPRRKRGTGL